jgi:hypothetical protein
MNRISQWEFPTEACARKETSDSLSEKNKKDEMKRDDKTATGPAATPVTSYEVTSTSDAQAGEKYDIKPDISLETWSRLFKENMLIFLFLSVCLCLPVCLSVCLSVS